MVLWYSTLQYYDAKLFRRQPQRYATTTDREAALISLCTSYIVETGLAPVLASLLNNIGQALYMSFSMFWEILWPLILGFTLSANVQSVVSHKAMAKTLGCEGPRCLTFATLYGIASSSCSYAAVALARSIFQKGASFVSAMAFEIALF